MKRRPWFHWVILIIVLTLIGFAIWAKRTADLPHTEPTDPGVPEVLDLPDPEDVE